MNEYRKTATVTAVKVEGTKEVKVYSLEGPAVALPGDYIVTAKTGESWVVAGPIFESTYEPVDGPMIDAGFAAGVAAERARIVAALHDASDLVGMFAYAVDFADLIDSGWKS